MKYFAAYLVFYFHMALLIYNQLYYCFIRLLIQYFHFKEQSHDPVQRLDGILTHRSCQSYLLLVWSPVKPAPYLHFNKYQTLLFLVLVIVQNFHQFIFTIMHIFCVG